jgi:hypothetical protein
MAVIKVPAVSPSKGVSFGWRCDINGWSGYTFIRTWYWRLGKIGFLRFFSVYRIFKWNGYSY